MDTRLTELRRENDLRTDVSQQIDGLGRMTVSQLRQKYIEVFKEESRSNHKQFLYRRIAWRIQALAEGGLSERARRRALEIANDADFASGLPKTLLARTSIPPDLAVRSRASRNSILACRPERFLIRQYKGREIIVRVLADGFAFEQTIYRSLCAIAREITGTEMEGIPAPMTESDPPRRVSKTRSLTASGLLARIRNPRRRSSLGLKKVRVLVAPILSASGKPKTANSGS